MSLLKPGTGLKTGSDPSDLREVLAMIKDGVATKQAMTHGATKSPVEESAKTDTTKSTTLADVTASVGKSSTNDTKNSGFSYENFSYDDYTESDAVKEAKAALDAHLLQEPGAYQSKWQDQLTDIYNEIMNRKDFSYDFNADALYQQYKDKYIQQGKIAMADAIGQTSAMTGGYGNSYAQSVGQQAYNAQLRNLNDVIPELYQMAYDRYNREGEDLYNQYALAMGQEEIDYRRHRDTVADYIAERDHLANYYDNERALDYGKYTDSRNFDYGVYSDEKSYAYNDHRDTIADQQWQTAMDYNAERDRVADQQWQTAMDYNAERDKVADQQWQATMDYNAERDKVADQQWQAMLDATSEAEEVEEAMSISDLKSAREFIGEVAQKASSLEDYQKIIAYIDVMGENGLSPSAMDALVREYIPDDVLEQLYGGGAGVTIDDLYLPDKQAITDMNDLINKAASGSPLSPEERARYNAMLAMVGA